MVIEAMVMKELKFTRDDDHVYRDQNGTIYLSVTQQLHLIGDLVDFSMVSSSVLDAATERGTFTHDAMKIWHTDEYGLDMNSLDPSYKKYVEACIDFFQKNKHETWVVESTVYDPRIRTAGTLDWLGILNKKLTILDYKSGVSSKITALQLAAYKRLWEYSRTGKHTIKNLLEVKLSKDGTYRQISHNLGLRSESVFVAICKVNWFKLELGQMPEGAIGNPKLEKLCHLIMGG